MTRVLQMLAAVFVLMAGIVFFTDEHHKVVAVLVIIGSILSMSAHFLDKRGP